jgi:hypothetical protein
LSLARGALELEKKKKKKNPTSLLFKTKTKMTSQPPPLLQFDAPPHKDHFQQQQVSVVLKTFLPLHLKFFYIAAKITLS